MIRKTTRSEVGCEDKVLTVMLLPSGNPIESHEALLSLLQVFLPLRFGMFFHLLGVCLQGLHAFRLLIQHR